MRPGQSCPGVVTAVPTAAASRGGFNEAGAIMPRSGRPPSRSSKQSRESFNEAGAIMPRSGGTARVGGRRGTEGLQ